MFKIGDEVVAIVDQTTDTVGFTATRDKHIPIGTVGTVTWVGCVDGDWIMSMAEHPTGPGLFWLCSDFRKVERKTETLTRWLSQPVGDTDKLDKSKRRARV